MSKATDIVSEIKSTESALAHELRKLIETRLNELIAKTGVDVSGIDIQLVGSRETGKREQRILLSGVSVLCELPE